MFPELVFKTIHRAQTSSQSTGRWKSMAGIKNPNDACANPLSNE